MQAMAGILPEWVDKIYGYADVTYALSDAQDEVIEKYGDGYVLWALAMPWGDNELNDPCVRKRYDLLVGEIRETIQRLSGVVDSQLFIPFYYDSDIRFIQDVTGGIECETLIVNENDLPLPQKRILFKHARHAIVM